MKTSANKKPQQDEAHYAAQRRVRPCLKCSQKFESNWFGERVCRPCKGGSTWQTSAMDMVGARAGR